MHVRLLLDTKYAVQRFYREAAYMSNIDYDIDDILSSIMSSFTFQPNVLDIAHRFAQKYRDYSQSNDDGVILSTAFLRLHDHVYHVAMQMPHVIWGLDLHCNYGYDTLQNDDLIIIRLPGR